MKNQDSPVKLYTLGDPLGNVGELGYHIGETSREVSEEFSNDKYYTSEGLDEALDDYNYVNDDLYEASIRSIAEKTKEKKPEKPEKP